MGLVVVGVSHKTAPVELREKLSVPKDRLPDVLKRLSLIPEVKESVVLSTCNRMEIYARPQSDRKEAVESLIHFYEDMYQHPRCKESIYFHEGSDAVHHLFKVASGLDSMVIGETEILGQVKSAYQSALANGATGKMTNVIFQRALFVGKEVRAQTDISEGGSSVGNVAVQLAEKIFGGLKNHRILLLGAGNMAEVAARHLLSQKASEISVMNRTLSKAQELAYLLNGTAKGMDSLESELLRADIVISSLAVEKPCIDKKMIRPIMVGRKNRSLYFIDIGVPRNVDPAVHSLDNAYLYNIDDLKGIVQDNIDRRRKSVETAEKLVRERSDELSRWMGDVLRGQTSALKHTAEPFLSGAR